MQPKHGWTTYFSLVSSDPCLLTTNLLLDHLLLNLSKSTKTVPSSSQTPTLDNTATQIEIATGRNNMTSVSTSLSFVSLFQLYRTPRLPHASNIELLPKILILLVRWSSLRRARKCPHRPKGVFKPRRSSHFHSTNSTNTKTS